MLTYMAVPPLLQSQFGVGLREAAHNLRICPTTLKRACRRHGIFRWPRRQSWAGVGGEGEAARSDSMSLDADSVSSAGVPLSQPEGVLGVPTPPGMSF